MAQKMQFEDINLGELARFYIKIRQKVLFLTISEDVCVAAQEAA